MFVLLFSVFFFNLKSKQKQKKIKLAPCPGQNKSSDTKENFPQDHDLGRLALILSFLCSYIQILMYNSNQDEEGSLSSAGLGKWKEVTIKSKVIGMTKAVSNRES